MDADVFIWAAGGVLLIVGALIVATVAIILSARALEKRLDRVIELLEQRQGRP